MAAVGQQPSQVRLPCCRLRAREISFGATLTAAEGSDPSFFCSPLGALHPTGGGDGWDGAGNEHE